MYVTSYVEFDFSDGECTHYPILVALKGEFKLSVDESKQLEKITQHKIDEYIENQEWDNDEIIVKEIMCEFLKDYNFDYEIIRIDLCINL